MDTGGELIPACHLREVREPASVPISPLQIPVRRRCEGTSCQKPVQEYRRGTWWDKSRQCIAVEGVDFAQDTQEGGGDEYEFIPDSDPEDDKQRDIFYGDDVDFVPDSEAPIVDGDEYLSGKSIVLVSGDANVHAKAVAGRGNLHGEISADACADGVDVGGHSQEEADEPGDFREEMISYWCQLMYRGLPAKKMITEYSSTPWSLVLVSIFSLR